MRAPTPVQRDKHAAETQPSAAQQLEPDAQLESDADVEAAVANERFDLAIHVGSSHSTGFTLTYRQHTTAEEEGGAAACGAAIKAAGEQVACTLSVDLIMTSSPTQAR